MLRYTTDEMKRNGCLFLRVQKMCPPDIWKICEWVLYVAPCWGFSWNLYLTAVCLHQGCTSAFHRQAALLSLRDPITHKWAAEWSLSSLHRVCTCSRCSSESIYRQYSPTPLGRWSLQQIHNPSSFVFFNLLLSIQENDGLRPDRLLPAQHSVQQHLPQHKIRRAVRQRSDSCGSSSAAEPVVFGFGPSRRTDATHDR